MARLLSVNVGQPREIAWRGRIVYPYGKTYVQTLGEQD